MKANILDLRYRMKDVLKALDRNEKVTILYHGKLKGVITAEGIGRKEGKIADHPFFNMRKTRQTIKQHMNALRGGRFRDL